MADIIIYTKETCPYCVKAKHLFVSKGYSDFTEINIGSDHSKFEEMVERTGNPNTRTVPQIFINGTYVGGCDDLYRLNELGKLDDLLEKSM